MAAFPHEQALIDSDEGLAGRTGRGDEAAFSELYRRYARPLAAFAGRILRDPAGGEDVAQTALLNAYRALSKGMRPLHVRPWLYQIARNAALNAARARRGEIVGTEELERATPCSESDFDREHWLAAVRSLPARQRDVYLLRDLNGASTLETAARLQLNGEQVEQALFAARTKLAEQITFGGRLDCDTIQAIDEPAALPTRVQPLVRAHLRSCLSCRRELKANLTRALTNLGLGLRQLAQWLLGGGAAPVTAKVSAIVASTALGTVAAPHAYHAVEHAVAATVQAVSAPAAAPTTTARLSIAARTLPAAPTKGFDSAARYFGNQAAAPLSTPANPAPTLAPDQPAPLAGPGTNTTTNTNQTTTTPSANASAANTPSPTSTTQPYANASAAAPQNTTAPTSTDPASSDTTSITSSTDTSSTDSSADTADPGSTDASSSDSTTSTDPSSTDSTSIDYSSSTGPSDATTTDTTATPSPSP